MNRAQLAEYFAGLAKAYPIISMEDPLAEEDFAGFAILGEMTDIQIVGDESVCHQCGAYFQGNRREYRQRNPD